MSLLGRAALVLALVFAGGNVLAQDAIDLGPEVSTYQRFMVYPHLQTGLDALARGDRDRAYAEFRRAMALAPQSPAVAAYLARAYRRFGDADLARQLLTEQLRRHPGDAQLWTEMAALGQSPQRTLPPADDRPTAPATADFAASSARPPTAAASGAGQTVRPAVSPPAPAPAPTEVTRIAPPRPALPPGYAQAERAFKASASGDFAGAAVSAREALALAPGNQEYRRLLAYSLLQSGDYEQARAVALAGSTADARLMDVARQARDRQAQAAYDTADRAQAAGDLPAAMAAAREGLDLAPNSSVHWLQWLGLLLADGDLARLEGALDEALRQDPANASELLALRAYARQRQGQGASAHADFNRAVQLAPDGGELNQRIRIMAADAAMAERQPQRAEELLAPLAPNTDITARRQRAEAAQQRNVMPVVVVPPGLAAPQVICSGAGASASCGVWPGQPPPDPGLNFAQNSYAASERQDYTKAAQLAEQAVRASPGNASHELLHARALMSDGKLEAAAAALDDYLKLHREPELLALRSNVLRRLGRMDAARLDASEALENPRLSVVSEIDLLRPERRELARQRFDAVASKGVLKDVPPTDVGYLAARVGNDEAAIQAFDQAAAKKELPPTALADAAYVAGRLGDSPKAVQYFRERVDAVTDGRLEVEPQRLFETRREIADRSRTWGVNATLAYRATGTSGYSLAPSNSGNVAQIVSEGYWRPQGYRDGRFWEVYGGAATNLYAANDATAVGAPTTQGFLGVRGKPLRDYGVWLFAERRFKIGSKSINDWLVRAAYSFDHGTDLRLDVPSWNTAHVFAEAGRFIEMRRNYATTEAQLGRSYRLGGTDARWVAFPHMVMGLEYDSNRTAAGYNGAAGIGAGIDFRYWFRESRYYAPRSYVNLSIQYRWRIAGDERGKGVFARAAFVF